MTLLAAIHGILTSQTDPSWPDKLDAWMYVRDPGVKVLKKEYRAGPFPRWNCWIKDPLLARSLANELELFLGQAVPPADSPDGSVAPNRDLGRAPCLPRLHRSGLWRTATGR